MTPGQKEDRNSAESKVKVNISEVWQEHITDAVKTQVVSWLVIVTVQVYVPGPASN